MTRGVLGEAVQEQVHIGVAMLVETRQRVVEQRQRAAGARAAGDVADVGDAHGRIGGRLEDHQCGGRLAQHAFDAGIVLDRQHGVAHAIARQGATDQRARGRVGFDEAQHMVAGLQQPQQRLRHGANARGADNGILAPLHGRQCLFELARGGIRRARIEEPVALAAQRAQGFGNRGVLELDALVDRRNQRRILVGRGHPGRMHQPCLFFHGRKSITAACTAVRRPG
jgi:hypothetical protein